MVAEYPPKIGPSLALLFHQKQPLE